MAVPAEAPGDVEAGQVRQADVEDDGIEAAARFDELEAILAPGCEVDDVALLDQESLKQASKARVVLDDEHVHMPVLPAVSEEFLKAAQLGARRSPSEQSRALDVPRFSDLLAISERNRANVANLLAKSEQPGVRNSQPLSPRATMLVLAARTRPV